VVVVASTAQQAEDVTGPAGILMAGCVPVASSHDMVLFTIAYIHTMYIHTMYRVP
jgi:hypothetical protein